MNYYNNKSILFELIDSKIGSRFKYDDIDYGDYIGNYKNKYILFISSIRIRSIFIKSKEYQFKYLTNNELKSLPTEPERLFILNNIFEHNIWNKYKYEINLNYPIKTVDNLYYHNMLDSYYCRHSSYFNFDYRIMILSINRLFIK